MNGNFGANRSDKRDNIGKARLGTDPRDGETLDYDDANTTVADSDFYNDLLDDGPTSTKQMYSASI